ncbi:hypothetical protein ASG31_04020 [Chryseobacterium sp. Leaf404]|uniref:CIS tube protein n=1 Tax=unclassified Chryseobacterium TaxID=2593645 RepID=UPI0006F3F07A|nr:MULTISPECIES: hypothetical protein [unclassified Chryseobacterium]KQT17914.1 hypothetical protein ASG31_04020 [Chryseobacterium sp. Leaf404]
MISGLLGITDKMRIEVFPTKEFTEPPQKTIYVQVNPEKYSLKHNVDFCEGQAIGTSGSDLRFNRIEGEEVNFEFLFDSSGVIPPMKIVDGKGERTLSDNLSDAENSVKPTMLSTHREVKTVEKEVEAFRKLLMGYSGDTHQTAFLRILWGGYKLDCRLKNMEIEYTLFRKDGRPIRAKVKCVFKGTVDYKTMIAQENKSSPDLTHQRTARMNDSLLLIAEDIYQNDGYYIDVAKNNRMLTFRKLETGQQITFPPIK